MSEHRAVFHSNSPEDTAQIAERLGTTMGIGDCLLLSGGIGAGKSHFARALVQSRLAVPEDVPSPTFTLVQTYEMPEADIWHADLYRLTDPDQIVELGLLDALSSSVTLIEWPDRLGTLTPENALHLTIADSEQNETRTLTFSWTDARWTKPLKALLA